MEQTAIRTTRRHAGWSEEENRLLWETADEAQQQGLPLKQVFEQIADRTGRKPNSIRNYYYAQVRQREGGICPLPRFVPFEEGEVEQLVEQVLRARAKGQSVRSCLQEMAQGDHSLMLRYQNKYRSVLKNRPELIDSILEKLKEEGVQCPPLQIRPRAHGTAGEACAALDAAARSVSDEELIRACDTLTRLILSGRTGEKSVVQLDRMNVRLDLYRLALSEKNRLLGALCEAADELTVLLKEFLITGDQQKISGMQRFCEQLSQQVGCLEGAISAAQTGSEPLPFAGSPD